MFEFKRDGTKVELTVDSGLTDKKWRLGFSRDCGKEFYAELLMRHLDKKFYDELEAIRKDAYEAGYRDGRSKFKKIADHYWAWEWRWLESDWWLAKGKKRRA